LLIVGGAIVGLLAIGTVTLSSLGFIRLGGSSARPDLITHKVAYEDLQLTITERGALESAENSDIICRVKARSGNSTVSTTIRWVIEDGTQVKRGDRLVQLDDSALHEALKAQKIVVDQARAAWVSAEKEYEIVESQNRSDTATQKLTLELARLDLEKYEKGEFVQALQEIEGRLMIARSDLTMWEERSAWSQRMSKPGRRYVTTAQAQADEARLRSAEIALAKVLEEKRVLEKFTGPRSRKDFQGKIEEGVRATERIEAQARAKEVKADADRRSKQSIYEQEQARYYDIEEEIKKCVILAPQDGLVVYYVSEQSRFGSGSQQAIIAQGEPVREGQKLMRIPNLSRMMVNTKIHEAMVSRVRGDKYRKTGFSESVQACMVFPIDPLARLTSALGFEAVRENFIADHRAEDQVLEAAGQLAKIRVEAFPDRLLDGEVRSVATVASQQDWMSADVKVYQALVNIKDELPNLKPGMTAEVTIFTDSQRENVLTVPLQAILGSVDMGNKRRIYVLTPNGPEAREVVVGLSNDRMGVIESGLAEGEEVIVNPRVLLTEADKAALGEYSGRGNENKGGPKGKGGPGGPGGPGGGADKGKGGWKK
jgi:multidrug efflux pump subunit AcrA (membrane-fusion protein)